MKPPRMDDVRALIETGNNLNKILTEVESIL